MKLKNAITLSAVALATAFTSGDLYAQKKKSKTKKVQEETVIGVQRGSNYGDPKDVKAEAGAFAIVPLKYKYFGLEEYIDEETMFIHFSKHYVAYLNNLNKAVAGTPQAQMSIEELLRTLDMNNATLRNNAGGYYNHNMYFAGMSPSGGNPKGALAAAIDRDFGSFENFKKAFAEAGAKRFGSGWAWLVVNNGKLQVVSTANQDNPLMPGLGVSGIPVLAMDVWEHAYYLKYQNRRPDYIKAFWQVGNWDEAARRFESAAA